MTHEDDGNSTNRSPMADSVRVELRGQADPAHDGVWLLDPERTCADRRPVKLKTGLAATLYCGLHAGHAGDHASGLWRWANPLPPTCPACCAHRHADPAVAVHEPEVSP